MERRLKWIEAVSQQDDALVGTGVKGCTLLVAATSGWGPREEGTGGGRPHQIDAAELRGRSTDELCEPQADTHVIVHRVAFQLHQVTNNGAE
jgi:hypothetical protein